ncbi:MAG TPA: acetyl-CoA acetyltransferase [Spirochaetota bacterium]|nr:acetyl-CoA acetyltransferase [Spirochaetota bacterium]HOJ29322.1 acetyl-CoA acetyltransferase [Spirochaetota bacterium]HOM10132.1 acetyl-CoA acetyltransferase [Spirochaetota bacterium]HPP49725.1 acetyl-CoA acetyltransferase [Spirochaetota bacterium]
MATGIKDKVAIIGMGCTKFGERWDADANALMVEAFNEAIADAGIDPKEIQAAWLATCFDEVNVGKSALSAAIALRLPNIAVTRVENFCASGTEAFRAAVYAVASGAYDIVLALGCEKLKDIGYGGLPEFSQAIGILNSLWFPNITAPGCFAMLAGGYCAKYGLKMEDVKRAMAHISVKSHANGALNPKAHLQRPVTEEQVLQSPMIAYPLGLFDCCGVSDGAACAIVCSVDVAKALKKKDFVTVKALQISVSNGEEMAFSNWDGAHVVNTEKAAMRAYQEAGIKNPREELSLLEVHDCFSITELVTMEDLHVSERGKAVNDVMDGFFDSNGKIPCQIDGGLKCFGHPIGASGLRMVYEIYLQLHGRADKRQLKDPRLGLTHNLGGFPMMNVVSVAIVGRYKQ